MTELVIPGLQGRFIGQFGNIWTMTYMGLKAGESVQTHEHEYDHVAYLPKGRVRLTVLDKSVVIEGPNFVFIPKAHKHGIEALEEGTDWICLHVTRDGEGCPEETFLTRNLYVPEWA